MRRMLRYGAVGLAVIAAAGVLLWLDLANRGLAWRVLWPVTGEEAPVSQMIGGVEYLGNITRVLPRTANDVPIAHSHTTPYGVNTFLQLEADPAVRQRSIAMIAEAGFGWIRQQFPWEDIEIHGRGDFEDRRNVEAIGVVSAWDKYDQIVDLAVASGVRIQARVDTPPRWTKADPNEGTLAPPDDWEDYYTFLRILAERYRGRITHYQIWNEPNIFPEWGNNPVDPEAYTAVLCRAYAVLKAVDPAIVVHAAALSPTVALTERDLSDLIYFQRMYDAGVSGCFDVMSAQGYGFFSGPTDQRLRPMTLNYARVQYIRDIMVANGDAAVPIWISEAAWNPVDEPDVPREIPGRENFGAVTEAQAAQYMPLAYARAAQEWNWVGAIMIWHWKRPDESERNQPFYYFRMVEPDFTPLPIYGAMRDHIAGEPPLLYAGVHQADHRFITAQGGPGDPTPAEGAQFGTARQGERFAFSAYGGQVRLRWRGERLTVTSGDRAIAFTAAPDADGWTTTLVADDPLDTERAFTLEADPAFLLDSVTVTPGLAPDLIPLIGVVAAGVALEGVLIGVLLWRRRRVHHAAR